MSSKTDASIKVLDKKAGRANNCGEITAIRFNSERFTMKQCPQCGRSFDDSQSFCLDDGTRLKNISPLGSQSTVVFPRKKRRWPYFLTGLFLITGISVGGIFLLTSRANDTNQSNAQITTDLQRPPQTPNPSASPTAPAIPSPTPAVAINLNANSPSVPQRRPISDEVIDTPDPAVDKPLPVIMRAEEQFIAFALHGCRKSGAAVECTFTLTNKGGDRRFNLWSNRIHLYDQAGNNYRSSDVQLGDQGDPGTITFVSGVSTKAKITFSNVASTANKVALIDIGFGIGPKYPKLTSIKFRGITLEDSK